MGHVPSSPPSLPQFLVSWSLVMNDQDTLIEQSVSNSNKAVAVFIRQCCLSVKL